MRYANDLPVFAAFDVGAMQFPGELFADVPTRLNAAMRNGALDMGAISAFAYARDAERYVLLPDLCIGARDEIVSVVLISRTPPALLNGAAVAVTGESESGRALLQILLERRYGVHATFEPTDDPLAAARAGLPAFAIGDTAVDAKLEFDREFVYDLGTLWRDWTSEQSVTAVWVARRDVYEQRADDVRGAMKSLTDAYSWGRAHPDAVVRQAQAFRARPAGFYENYYAKLNFTFHSAAQSGLAAYCRELLAIGAIDRLPPVVPEVIGVSR